MVDDWLSSHALRLLDHYKPERKFVGIFLRVGSEHTFSNTVNKQTNKQINKEILYKKEDLLYKK